MVQQLRLLLQRAHTQFLVPTKCMDDVGDPSVCVLPLLVNEYKNCYVPIAEL